MKILVVPPSEKNAWDLFIESAQNATAYHQFRWKAVITKSFGHPAYYLAAVDEQGEWQGVLPLVHLRSKFFGNFMVSLPFVNYGGILCNNVTAERLLLQEAERLRCSSGATHVELRHLARCLEGMSTRQHKVTMVLDLATDIETQWKTFPSKMRNHIRKAEKSGLKFEIGHLDLLDDFYEVFARNMRDLGTPVYAKCFFHNVLEAFPESTRIFAVYREGRVIAAGIASWFRDTLEVPWASSLGEYRVLCPNNMLYWEAVQFAIKRGFKRLDFGRSTPHEGTYDFKKQWGAVPVQLYWQYLMDGQTNMPDLNPANPKYKTAIRVWQHLPVSATKVLGPMIVRNIP